MKNIFYHSPYFDACTNLAIDEHLLNTAKPGEMYLLLYVNKGAVIIGRNQNPWRECSLDDMKNDGVELVRRISGGGAVYHDMGNLNFSFITGECREQDNQIETVLTALERIGIKAAMQGRNDLCIGERKFSGIAWSSRGKNTMRHGTLLIDSNLNNVERYLSPSIAKLKAKGVASVRKRVCNLSEHIAGLTVPQVAEALKNEFGTNAEYIPTPEDEEAINKLRQRNASDEWTMGETPRFDYTIERRFDWGLAELCLTVKGEIITGVKVYTDAMDTELPKELEASFIGKRFELAVERHMRCAESVPARG